MSTSSIISVIFSRPKKLRGHAEDKCSRPRSRTIFEAENKILALRPACPRELSISGVSPRGQISTGSVLHWFVPYSCTVALHLCGTPVVYRQSNYVRLLPAAAASLHRNRPWTGIVSTHDIDNYQTKAAPAAAHGRWIHWINNNIHEKIHKIHFTRHES